MDAQNTLPQYVCHRVVRAAKIVDIYRNSSMPVAEKGAWRITVLNPESSTPRQVLEMDGRWVAQHQPQIGGYVVVFLDGHVSFTPADVFEHAYSKVEPEPERTIRSRSAVTHIEG